jgi:hypothetical protein
LGVLQQSEKLYTRVVRFAQVEVKWGGHHVII